MGMLPEQFSENKNNNKIPYKYIVSYCMRNNININWVLDSTRLPIHQIESTEQINDWFLSRKYKLYRLIHPLSKDINKSSKDNEKFSKSKNLEEQSINEVWKYTSKNSINIGKIVQTYIFNYNYKINSKISIFIIIFWSIIVFLCGYFFGYENNKKNHVVNNYEQEVKDLKQKHKILKNDIIKLINKEE